MKRVYIVAMAVVAMLLLGVGSAYFSDVAKSNGNSFSSGEFDVAVSKDGHRFYDDYKLFSFDGMKPGDERIVRFYVKNRGDVPVSKISMRLNVADREDGKLSKAEALVDNTTEVGELSPNLVITSFNVTVGNVTRTLSEYIGKSLKDLNGTDIELFSGRLEQNEKIEVTMGIKFREDAGNECQTDIADVNMTLYATQ
ncbi:MAG: methyltransferase [Thermococci archaeon]|nr:methyltransferase [Thermococci archaeon]